MKLYVVVPAYTPNTAALNRIIALLKGFSAQEIKTIVTFLVSDGNNSKVQEIIPHVSFEYMWEGSPLNRRFFCRFLEKINFRKYVRRLPRGASVFLPFPSSRLMSLLVRRKDLRVYYEETELPELYSIRNFELKEYFAAIPKLSGIFVISTALRDFFIEQGLSSDKVQIINMLVDETRFENIKKKNSGVKYIAYCGSVSSFKDGVDDLIRAFVVIQHKHPEIRLYIIGPIPREDDKNIIIEMIKDNSLENSVHFTGIISYQDIPQVLKDAEVLVLARPNNIQAKYGFPTKLGEYLLSGNPVVVTSVGDIPLYLKDGYSAMIAEPNKPDEFADKVCWLLEHQDEAHEIGERGKEVARASFNNVIEAQKIVQFISQKKNN